MAKAAVKKPAQKKAPAKKPAPKKEKKAAPLSAESAPETAPKAPKAAKPPKTEGKPRRWFVVQTQSNYEKRVQTLINEQVLIQGLGNLIEEVLIPTEQVIEVKKGVKSKSERKFFPGYVLVKADMTDEAWHLLKNIPHVTNFVGSNRGKKPLPISNKEAERMLQQMEDGVEIARPAVIYEVGEEVRVTDGPFNSFQGMVEEVDDTRSRLKVSVSIFGRATPIELDFTQVEKA